MVSSRIEFFCFLKKRLILCPLVINKGVFHAGVLDEYSLLVLCQKGMVQRGKKKRSCLPRWECNGGLFVAGVVVLLVGRWWRGCVGLGGKRRS
jgi:hypothetical protein